MLSQTNLSKPTISEKDFWIHIAPAQNTDAIGPLAIDLLEKFNLNETQIGLLAKDKDIITNYVIGLKSPDVLFRCLDPLDPLGKVFWFQRGSFTPSLVAGCLSRIRSNYCEYKGSSHQIKLVELPDFLKKENEATDLHYGYYGRKSKPNNNEYNTLYFHLNYFKNLSAKLNTVDPDLILGLLSNDDHKPEVILSRIKFLPQYNIADFSNFISDYFKLLERLVSKNVPADKVGKLLENFLKVFEKSEAKTKLTGYNTYKNLFIDYLNTLNALKNKNVKVKTAIHRDPFSSTIEDSFFGRIDIVIEWWYLGERSTEILFKLLQGSHLSTNDIERFVNYKNSVYDYIERLPVNAEKLAIVSAALDKNTGLGTFFAFWNSDPSKGYLKKLYALYGQLNSQLPPLQLVVPKPILPIPSAPPINLQPINIPAPSAPEAPVEIKNINAVTQKIENLTQIVDNLTLQNALLESKLANLENKIIQAPIETLYPKLEVQIPVREIEKPIRHIQQTSYYPQLTKTPVEEKPKISDDWQLWPENSNVKTNEPVKIDSPSKPSEYTELWNSISLSQSNHQKTSIANPVTIGTKPAFVSDEYWNSFPHAESVVDASKKSATSQIITATSSFGETVSPYNMKQPGSTEKLELKNLVESPLPQKKEAPKNYTLKIFDKPKTETAKPKAKERNKVAVIL